MKCAWAKFKELSPFLTVRGASYRIKGRIYSACVQSILIYGTEKWAMKADDLRSLEKTERIVIVNRHLKNATPNKCSSRRRPQQLSKY